MQFDVITIFPEMFNTIKDEGIVSRAIKNNLIKLNLHQLRDYSDNKYRNIDDKPYGGGGGMVMQVKPIRSCINAIKKIRHNPYIIYLSPQGKTLNQSKIKDLGKKDNIILLCGRYEGVDERIITYDIDEEISIGDFVLSGGELPAMILIDTIGRQLKGALGNENSINDSFQNQILDYPHYTRPQEIDKQKIPEVLLQGNQVEIDKWRMQQALKNTSKKRQDLL